MEEELGVRIIAIDKFYSVFDKLIENNYIVVKIEDEKAVPKKGTIELSISFKGLDYVVENKYVDIKEAFQYSDRKFCDIIDIFMIQFRRMEKTENDLKEQKKELLGIIKKQEIQIKNFYNNILTILGILVAVFSIVPFL